MKTAGKKPHEKWLAGQAKGRKNRMKTGMAKRRMALQQEDGIYG